MLVGCGDGEGQRGSHLKMIKHQARDVDGEAGRQHGVPARTQRAAAMGTVTGSPGSILSRCPRGWGSCTGSGSRQVAAWSPPPALRPVWQEEGPGGQSMFALGLEADGDWEVFPAPLSPARACAQALGPSRSKMLSEPSASGPSKAAPYSQVSGCACSIPLPLALALTLQDA